MRLANHNLLREADRKTNREKNNSDQGHGKKMILRLGILGGFTLILGTFLCIFRLLK